MKSGGVYRGGSCAAVLISTVPTLLRSLTVASNVGDPSDLTFRFAEV
jgi:hypothetical protein